jgi:hypothetical protein
MAGRWLEEGSARPAAVAAAAALVAGGGLVALAVATGISPEVLLRDPAQQFGFVVYAGFVSISGIFLVIGAAAVTFLAATLVPRRRALLLAAALLSGIIAYDDQFVFHDRIAGVHLGFPGWILMAAYGLAALALLLHPAVRAAPGGLILSGGLLGLSAAVDLALPYSVPVLVAEDLLKLAGYAAWFGFWLVFARAAIRQAAGGIEYVSDARATGSAVPSE